MQRKSIFYYSFLICFVLFVSMSVSGCKEDLAEYEKQVLAYDPSFQKIIDKRNALRGDVGKERMAFLEQQKIVDGRIDLLRDQKLELKKEYSSKVEKVKRQILPEKRRLTRELIDLEHNHNKRNEQAQRIERDINEINNLIKKKDVLDLTQEEIKNWNSRIASLIERKEMVISKRDKYKKEIEMTKLKLKVLNI